MKIGIEAHILEGNRTGVGRVLINILQQWNNFDLPNNLELILYFKKEIPEDLKLTKSNFKFKLLKTKSNALFRHYFLCKEATKDKLDILFCPDYVSPIFYFKKTALILHDISYEVSPETYNWPSIWDKILLKYFSKISAKKAKYIFVVSEYTKKEVIKYYKIKEDKIFVIPLAVDNKFKVIKDQDKIQEIKNKYNIKDKFILYLGSIFDRRHLKEVVEAFDRIRNKLPNYQFLIVGRNYTKQKFNQSGILRQDYIEENDLVILYNAADLFIYISDYEGFGLPVLEALACNTPVVTSPITSIPEVVGEAGIYVNDPKNINQIEKAIYTGLTNNELRENLINKGLEQVNKFSWKKSSKKCLDVLMALKNFRGLT